MKKLDDSFRKALDTAFHRAISHLESLDETSVAATDDLPTLRAHLTQALNDEGLAPDQVVEELADGVAGGLLGSAGGRFFGWVIGGTLPAALAADWLTSAWHQNGALYACSPAAAVVEEAVGGWLKEVFGLPTKSSFALVSGCQMAHATCLAAARHGLLARHGWNVEELGLYGAPPIRILSSSERHGSFQRAVRLLGFGDSNIVLLDVDAKGRLLQKSLRAELARKAGAPALLLLQAGDVNIGAYDDFASLIPVARKFGAWVHVDGAFGLWAAASPRLRYLLDGVDLADSWATDGHKWLNVPFDSGFAFVADPESHRASLSHRAAYLSHATDVRDQIDWNPEWSRRSRGFAAYAALRQLGRKGLADLVDRGCRHAHALTMRIGSLRGAEVLWEPVINQGLVRFLDSRPGANEADHDRRTDAVIAAVLDTGEAFFGGTTWRGKRAMRISVCNWQTNEGEVDRVINAVREVLARGQH